MLDQLRSARSGLGFDWAFQQIPVEADQAALALHQNYATQGYLTALRNVAAQIVPIVQMPLQAAQAPNMRLCLLHRLRRRPETRPKAANCRPQ